MVLHAGRVHRHRLKHWSLHRLWAFTTSLLKGPAVQVSTLGPCKGLTLPQAVSRLSEDKVRRQYTGKNEGEREGSEEDIQKQHVTKSFQSPQLPAWAEKDAQVLRG